ncbi:MAG: methyltransferase domain-containing protein [Nitrososphaerota archaeon]|nr:class I SAM-dependent methyltransferase [Nitrososphaerota archaeon]MDG6927394.1 methyltransferase domain-containing protein [Nitrososphaerota archaeon]MDG6931198.1 methyltransferase domain-containing protein [Nitrososphaerota archaeon]MDG6931861.1 methyltransferase domain-containing protein [Nitrososphaerota archaeon]MDG6936619.1 methyltransferase domain-containing protein [Nitrososphaerota archaeon]
MHGRFRGSGYSDVPASMREEMVPLQELLRAMAIRKEDIIADLGAGAGYYSFAFAKLASKVYAIDGIEENAKLIGARGVANVFPVTADLCYQIPVKDFTYAFFSNSLHDMECWKDLIGTLYGILPEGGRLAVLDFKPDTPFGPPHARISADQLDQVAFSAGFSKRGTVDFRYHYLSLFNKKTV